MKVSEFIAESLARFGTHHVFMLTGGGAMFLNDTLWVSVFLNRTTN
jgi:thiamine pyrophosphate-dependent acetolactate synthase large subunit-like protein